MNKLFRSYLAFLLMGALLFTSTACDDDDPDPIDEGEVITTVTLALTAVSKGQDAAATISTLSGTPVQDGPLVLKANAVYTGTITLSDASRTPAVNVTDEIRQKRNEHIFIYVFSPQGNSAADVDVQITDTDQNNLPVGLETTITAGPETGAGKLRVILKHQPGGIKTGASIAGETDIEVDFDVIIN